MNGERWLRRCLASVLSTSYPTNLLEVIVVDNGSLDASRRIIDAFEASDTRIRKWYSKKNLGWSPANNVGIAQAKGDIIVLLSNDLEVDKMWLEEIVNVFDRNSESGVVQCLSLSMDDRTAFDSGSNYLDRFGYSYSYAPIGESEETFFAEGMAFAIRRSVFEKVGLLDDYYFMEYDDMDFSWRARLAGFKVYVASKAKVYHARGGTVGKTYFDRLPNVERYVRNHIATLVKNYSTGTLVGIIPSVIVLELAKSSFLLVRKKSPTLLARTVTGMFRALIDLPIILASRHDVQRIRKLNDRDIMKVMHPFSPSVLLQFIKFQMKGKRPVLLRPIEP